MLFLSALGGVFSLIIVVALGYFLAARGWFSPTMRKLMPRLVTNVALPPFLATTIISSFPPESLFSMLSGVIPPFCLMLCLFILAFIAGRALNINKQHFGLFCACVSNPNTIFIGIPVNIALFGNDSLPYVLLYYFASTTFFWTVGNYFISRDGKEGVKKSSGKFNWQRIFSAPLIGFIIGVIFLARGWSPPPFIMNAGEIIGQLTTPLALLYIGGVLKEIGLANLRINRDMAYALAGRMILSPLLMWLYVFIFNLPALMGKVFIIQSSLPVIMQIAILSGYYDTDPKFGAMMVAVSTIICVITIPAYMVIF